MFNEPFKERRRDVVGKIAHNVERFAWQVDCQGIAFDDFDVRSDGRPKTGDQVPIHFNCNHASRCGREHGRERAFPRTDFKNSIVRVDVCKLNDAFEYGPVREEMLSEAFFQLKETSRTGFEPVLQP